MAEDQDLKDKNGSEDKPLRFCMLCQRSEKDAGALLTLPGGMTVCNDCLQRSMDTISQSGFPGFFGAGDL